VRTTSPRTSRLIWLNRLCRERGALLNDRPRYGSKPLPPYSYVPGVTPHPVSDPRGHMHGHMLQKAEPLDPARWRTSGEYLYGVDLFNHGFYWEAHEAWESLWHAAGRKGAVATWLKSLIKLAAAAVKLREGKARGVQRHARRALELLHELETSTSPDQAWSGLVVREGVGFTSCGIELAAVREIAESLMAEAQKGLTAAPTRVLDSWLRLDI
jgi:uncharacterized protein